MGANCKRLKCSHMLLLFNLKATDSTIVNFFYSYIKLCYPIISGEE